MTKLGCDSRAVVFWVQHLPLLSNSRLIQEFRMVCNTAPEGITGNPLRYFRHEPPKLINPQNQFQEMIIKNFITRFLTSLRAAPPIWIIKCWLVLFAALAQLSATSFLSSMDSEVPSPVVPLTQYSIYKKN